jgi:fumarylacetoacetate (FAA) hydrolase
MRLARISIEGVPVVATIDGDMATPVATGPQADIVAIAAARVAPPPIADAVPLTDVQVLTPVVRPPTIRDFMAFEAHARDSRPDRQVDPGWYEHPLFYFSNPNVVRGPEDLITPPAASRCLDYELEVACVIGTSGSDLNADDPATLDAIAGFTIMNDWSARDVQAHEMRQNLGAVKGKDFATSFGPVLVTPDELPESRTGRPRARMTARVNGEIWSEGELSDIHFSWSELLAYASRDSVLLPGDVLGSGTVGSGCILELRTRGMRDTRHWLNPGDVVELEVERLGTLRNRIAVIAPS